MNMANFQEKIDFIWDLADLLRGVYKRNEYQKVILPFTVLKRFDCALIDSKNAVLQTYNKYKDQFENMEPVLQNAAKGKNGNSLEFYNYSKYDFKTLLEDPEHIEQNLMHYLDCFSKNVQDIFENFHIKAHIARLAKADLLFLLIKKFSESKVDLHPDVVSNHEMGSIFEELIRKFAEQSNEEAGEHFTPRDVVGLMTKLILVENGENLEKRDIIKTVYDPACGTGGMLTSCKDFIIGINREVDVVLFGQEVNEEIYAICKADMLMKGENEENIKGPFSTLSKDQFSDMRFDFIISNPPYGRKWEQDEDAVKKEAEKGFEGRFGAGLPRINDGQLLFLQHMISKMKTNEKSRIAVITNGSPLFTGDAGQGESDIRKWMIENDYVEAIIALPDQLFFNTGIHTYIWVLTNEKPAERVGRIQLIDATSFYKKMRRSLGNKRNYLGDDDSEEIVRLYDDFKENKYCKVFDNEEFGYTKVIVERPLKLNYKASEERLESLYSVKSFSKLAESKKENPELKLKEEEEGRKRQEEIINALRRIGNHLCTNWDEFEAKVKAALKEFGLEPNFIENVILALSEHDDSADYVLDKKSNKLPDPNIRDSEKIPLKQDIKEYFEKEVKPYYPDAWMDRNKDKIGYEINFTQYFYKYVSPRSLEEIEKDIKKVTEEIQELIKEDVE
jgi:type I restriction enzyme M protein